MFTAAEFSSKHSRTLCGPCSALWDVAGDLQVVFRFCKVHETSRTLKVTCGAKQGQEEAPTPAGSPSNPPTFVPSTPSNPPHLRSLHRPQILPTFTPSASFHYRYRYLSLSIVLPPLSLSIVIYSCRCRCLPLHRPQNSLCLLLVSHYM